jgi:type I restriction enzyme S subunit
MTEEQARVPKLRFPGFADAWEQRKLGEIAKITFGQSPEGKNYTDNPNDHILVQGNADLKDGRVSPRVWTTQVTKLALAGDFIFSVRAPVGDVGVTDYPVVLGRGVAGLRARKFVFSLLEKFKIEGYWTRFSSGSTFESVNSKEVKEAQISCPSELEQEQIGDFFAQLDAAIALHQRKLSHLELLKKGLLQKMFPKQGEAYPEIRFPGFSGAWEQCKLGDIAEFSKGRGYSKDDLRTDGDPIILYGRLYTDYEAVVSSVNTYVTKKPNSVLSRGDEIIVPASGETAEDIARASVVKTPGIILGGDLNVIRLKISFAPEFVVREISNGPCQKELSKKAQGKSVVHIHSSDLQEVVLKYPRLSEQRQISSFFASLDDLTALHRRKLSHLQQQKKALLQQMFV